MQDLVVRLEVSSRMFDRLQHQDYGNRRENAVLALWVPAGEQPLDRDPAPGDRGHVEVRRYKIENRDGSSSETGRSTAARADAWPWEDTRPADRRYGHRTGSGAAAPQLIRPPAGIRASLDRIVSAIEGGTADVITERAVAGPKALLDTVWRSHETRWEQVGEAAAQIQGVTRQALVADPTQRAGEAVGLSGPLAFVVGQITAASVPVPAARLLNTVKVGARVIYGIAGAAFGNPWMVGHAVAGFVQDFAIREISSAVDRAIFGPQSRTEQTREHRDLAQPGRAAAQGSRASVGMAREQVAHRDQTVELEPRASTTERTQRGKRGPRGAQAPLDRLRADRNRAGANANRRDEDLTRPPEVAGYGRSQRLDFESSTSAAIFGPATGVVRRRTDEPDRARDRDRSARDEVSNQWFGRGV